MSDVIHGPAERSKPSVRLWISPEREIVHTSLLVPSTLSLMRRCANTTKPSPEGIQSMLMIALSWSVTRRKAPPWPFSSMGMRKMSWILWYSASGSWFDRNASVLPSGDQRGDATSNSPSVSCFGSPPLLGTMNRWLRRSIRPSPSALYCTRVKTFAWSPFSSSVSGSSSSSSHSPADRMATAAANSPPVVPPGSLFSVSAALVASFLSPFALASSASFLSCSLSAEYENAIHRPSGDHSNSPTPRFMRVSCRASPPLVGMTHICGLPERVERNAIWPPFGDHLGVVSRLLLPVNLAGSLLPSVDTSQMLDA